MACHQHTPPLIEEQSEHVFLASEPAHAVDLPPGELELAAREGTGHLDSPGRECNAPPFAGPQTMPGEDEDEHQAARHARPGHGQGCVALGPGIGERPGAENGEHARAQEEGTARRTGIEGVEARLHASPRTLPFRHAGRGLSVARLSTRERPETPTLPGMTDAELTARLYTNLGAFKTLQARHGPLRMNALRGVRAFALPRGAEALVQQQVLYDDVPALTEALEPLAAWYREQGVPVWRVPVRPGDAAVEPVLTRAGFRPGDSQPAMGLVLEHPLPPCLPPGVRLEHPEDLDEVLALNALAYGPGHTRYFEEWRARPMRAEQLHAVVLREAGRALAGAVSFEHGGTAGVYLVATHPEARRRGLGSLVMQALHADAHARGCTTAVLQATPMGYSVYQHLGYRDLGAWSNWVYRTGSVPDMT